jgi:hypothetical protein
MSDNKTTPKVVLPNHWWWSSDGKAILYVLCEDRVAWLPDRRIPQDGDMVGLDGLVGTYRVLGPATELPQGWELLLELVDAES